GAAEGVPVYVAAVDGSCRASAFELTTVLRDAGIAAEVDHRGRSLKAQFKQADKIGARAVVVLGPKELAAGMATLRDMQTKEEATVALDDVVTRVAALLG
ncbi:MAG: His/Gly/Thr/Pro-type tRNA ligase C-terminal domain-containing protein, partial [Coriobacteriia bacterium]|nr:His/Gly/Thr/Pro-type tRNA ligase C-terminal domain-containing protein [Coriobacteriia bacterium]